MQLTLFPKPESLRPPKPFLKWAGGKRQLLPFIRKSIPKKYHTIPFTYIEPFVGGGALLFYLLRTYPNLQQAIISDANAALINTYRQIQQYPYELISQLQLMDQSYKQLPTQEQRKIYFLEKRQLFNQFLRTADFVGTKSENTLQAALFIFLNRTCFNGLFRVNRKNQFNVPFGNYQHPAICQKALLLSISKALQKVEIKQGDFEQDYHFDSPTLVYFDPPYRPISKTASFNAYTKTAFDDTEQVRLKLYCDQLHQKGYDWIVSNSDPTNTDIKDTFFDELYQEYHIQRVAVKRLISAYKKRREPVRELLITNFG